MAALRKPELMTAAEFLAWEPADASNVRWQLIDGEQVSMAPASETHAALQAEIGALIRNHVVASASRCALLSQPGIAPRVGTQRDFRIPGLGVTRAPAGTGVTVPHPVLLIEIFSPGNISVTLANIWAYATIPSVREIVAVNSTRIEAEVLRRGSDGAWPEARGILTSADTMRLETIGFDAVLPNLYRTTALVS